MPDISSTEQKNLQGWIALGLSLVIAGGSAMYYVASISPRIDALEKQSEYRIEEMQKQLDKLDTRTQRIEQNQITRTEWEQMQKSIEQLVNRDARRR